MADCEIKLAGNFTRACSYKPKQGVNKKYYGNWDDIDQVATQKANRGTKVTLLVLKTGAKIYEAQGNDKSHRLNHAIAIGDYGNGYIHTDGFTMLYRGEEERERIQELAEGARVFTIVKKIDTGINGELSYEIAGLESGMVITEDNWNSAENSGTTTVTVATKEGEEESTGVKLFLPEGGVADVDAFIEANLYVEPVEPEV